MDTYNTQAENMDYTYFQNTISLVGNIKNLSIVYGILSVQKAICLVMYASMKQGWPELWEFQQDHWYYFALILVTCQKIGSYMNHRTEQQFPIYLIVSILFFITLQEAYLVHFCLCFCTKQVEISYWIFQLGVFFVFTIYFQKFCSRVDFKALSKVQMIFSVILTIILASLFPSQVYYILLLGFLFNIFAYVLSYKTIQFLFIQTYGWQSDQFIRSSFDLFIDNQVLFPLALIDTANFVVDAIGHE